MVINYCCPIKVDRRIKIRLGYRFHDGRVCFFISKSYSVEKRELRRSIGCHAEVDFRSLEAVSSILVFCGYGCPRKERGDSWHINLGILPQISPPGVFCRHLQCAAPNFERETACASPRAERLLSQAASRIALSPHRASQQDESGN